MSRVTRRRARGVPRVLCEDEVDDYCRERLLMAPDLVNGNCSMSNHEHNKIQDLGILVRMAQNRPGISMPGLCFAMRSRIPKSWIVLVLMVAHGTVAIY